MTTEREMRSMDSNEVFINQTIIYLVVVIILLAFPMAVLADDQELAKASQNPVAAMISVPIKNKFNFDAGPEDAFFYDFDIIGFEFPVSRANERNRRLY